MKGSRIIVAQISNLKPAIRQIGNLRYVKSK
jgi:hypothetical protein